jgi:predicted ATPase
MIVGTGYAHREKIEETADFSLIRACREADGVPVLLKVLRADKATRAEVARFKHQYERIAQLASPRLVALRGVEELSGSLIVVLEYPLRLEYAKKTGLLLSLCGQHDDALAVLSDCLERAVGRLDRTEVRRLKMNVQVLKNDLPAALAEGLAALRPFGIDLPPFPDEAMVDAQIRATMDLVREKTLEALPDLPPLAGPEIRAMQDVLQELFAPCWLLSPNHLGITVANVLETTLRHGLSEHAINGSITFAMFLCGRGDIELGYRFGRAAIDLSERYPDKKSEAMLRNIWGGTVQHWKEGYAACKESLLVAMHAGLETGQYIWSFYSTINAITNSLLRGLPLSDLLAEAQSYQPICKLDRFNAITWMVGRYAELFHVSEQAIVGRTDYDVFPRERADAFRAVDHEVLATGTALQAEEHVDPEQVARGGGVKRAPAVQESVVVGDHQRRRPVVEQPIAAQLREPSRYLREVLRNSPQPAGAQRPRR